MANVLFKRGNTNTINGTAITDGQLLYNTTTGQHYIDSDLTRVEVGKPVVNTMAEVSAITEPNIPCGTLAVKELNSNLILPYDNDGKIINRLKAFVSNIAIPYLDGSTLFTTVNLQNVFSDKSSMIAVVSMYDGYDVPRCNITSDIITADTVNVFIRADASTTFQSDAILYASLLVVGK